MITHFVLKLHKFIRKCFLTITDMISVAMHITSVRSLNFHMKFSNQAPSK